MRGLTAKERNNTKESGRICMANLPLKFIASVFSVRKVGLALTALLVILYILGNPLLDVLELKTYDMRLLAHPAAPGPTHVAIAAIDEKSLSVLGRWPWSRATMGKLVERLDQAGAGVIVFDVFFSETENRQLLDQLARLEAEQGYSAATSPYQAIKKSLAGDTSFSRAIKQSGKVVLPMVFLMSPDEARHQSPDEAARGYSSIENHAIQLIKDRGDGSLAFPMAQPHGVVVNLPELSASARYIGHINAIPDNDGTVRWTALVIRYKGLYFPSADVQAARLFLNAPHLTLHTSAYGITGLSLGERRIATDEDGRTLIHYHGRAKTFPTYSIADIMAGKIDAGLLKGKIVLIGATALGLGDTHVTPFSSVYPGVEIRANTIQNILDADFILRPGWMFVMDVAVMLGLGLGLVLLLPRIGVRNSALVVLGLVVFYIGLAVVEFRTQQIWMNLVYPSLLMLLLFMAATIIKYFTSENEKRQIKGAFKQYVPAAVVDQIMGNIDNLSLGGEKRELTVLFSDIRGFTTLSETLAPEDVVKMLNTYLTRMTDTVFRHDGLLDKYIGDAIMAIYGAPLAHPAHAKLACYTALDMMKELHALKEQWGAQAYADMDIGIGITTGPMIVGNMGSMNRFDYTVIGDAVNLGSRIEGLNKIYGTHILISEPTYKMVKDEFPYIREIDVTPIRGRLEMARIYELMLPELYPHMDWLAEFHRAYELFRANLHPQARKVFQALANDVRDPVSTHYIQRCVAPRRRMGD